MVGLELYYRTLIMPHDAFGETELAGRPRFIGNDDVDVLDWASDLIVWATKISIHPPEDDSRPADAPVVHLVTSALFALDQDDSGRMCGIVSPFSTLARLYSQKALALDHAKLSPVLDLQEVARHTARSGLLAGWTGVRDSNGTSVVQTVLGKAMLGDKLGDGDEVLTSVMLSYGHTSVTLLRDSSGVIHEHPDELQLLGQELRECLKGILIYRDANATT